MRASITYLLLFSIFFLQDIYAQDTLFLRDKSIIPSIILSADSNYIRVKKLSHPDGPDYVYSRSEIERIKLQNGHEILYHYVYFETAIGLNVFRDYYSPFEDGGRNISTSYRISVKGITTDFLLRGNIFSLNINAGYAQIVQDRLDSYYYYYGPQMPPSSGLSENINRTNAFHLMIRGRINFSHDIVNPFLSAGFGLNNYHSNIYYPQSGVISRFGFGIQLKVRKSWLVETQIGFGKAPMDSYDKVYYSYLELSLHKIILMKYYHE